MSITSVVFCTDCGAKNDDKNLFCVNCGFSILQLEVNLPLQTPVDLEPKIRSKVNQPIRKKKLFKFFRNAIVFLLILLVGASAGAVITAQGLLENLVGKRLTESEAEQLQSSSMKAGYEKGFVEGERVGLSEGKSKGLQEGESKGLQEGFENGCNSVFDKIGESLIAIRYPWYDSSIYGFYWGRASVCD